MTSLADFVNTARSNGFVDIAVRGRRDARFFPGGRVRELRTKKHTHRAVAFDELGNATVLTRGGRVIQLVGREADQLPR